MPEAIAIIGSACRFPGGASSVSCLWNLLKDPKDILDDFSSEFRSQCGIFNNDDDRTNRSYLLQEDLRRFDATFFRINKKEADAMDPQHRILLETVFEAIESAGWPLTQAKGSSTSVHVGVMTADHNDIQMRDPETLQTYAATGLARSMLANRISYFFDFKGPSETIDTACSSSLVALHHAVQSIQTGDAEQAIVAGSALFLDSAIFLAESKLQMLSPDSRSRMWDKDANGYSRGEGCAAILVKPLSKAIKDGDDIECVIRASAVNSDGRTSGITMPSVKAQADLIRRTYIKAGLDPVKDRCQYFECHGTGTPAGDPVEAAAIQQAFFPVQSEPYGEVPLYCGSIKTVVGHLEGCAGLAGILKALLAIRNKAIPPNLHFNGLNPKIKPHYDNLCVPTSLLPWPEVDSGPLRASVNSFGFGGTNAHVILESFDRKDNPENATEDDLEKATHLKSSLGPFVFSAECEWSLLEYLKRISEYLHRNPSVDLDAMERTLFARRSILSTRTYVTALDRSTLLDRLDEKVRAAEADEATQCGMRISHVDPASPPRILGIFTGQVCCHEHEPVKDQSLTTSQGAQWTNMGRELIRTCLAFKTSLETCSNELMSLPHAPSWSLMDALSNGDLLPETLPAEMAQPMCTAIQIALVDLLQAIGVKLGAVVGHSSGEISAAYAAGILSTRDAMSIAYYRGAVAHLAASPMGQKGAMLAVGMGLDEAWGLCSMTQFVDCFEVAASNSPSSTTLSGDRDAIYEAKEFLDGKNIFAKVLRIDVAYHSRHMAPCAKKYVRFLKDLDIQPQPASGHCIWYSSVRDGVDLTSEGTEQFKSQYWVENMVKPVLFQQALQTTLERCPDFAIALEVGPHSAMRLAVRDTMAMLQKMSVHYIGCLERGKNDVESMSAALGFIWCCSGDANVNLDNWRRMKGRYSQPTPLKGLPAYAWNHESIYWQVSRVAKRQTSKKHPPHELLGRLDENLKYDVTWRNIFGQDDLPWIKGHMVQGQVVFPAAGYVSMAAQAAYQLFAPSLATIELHDVKIRRPLVLPEGSDKVETLFKLKIRDRASESMDPPGLEANFTCYSGPAGGDLSKSCEGKLLARATGPLDILSPPDCTYNDTLPPVDISRWFTALDEIGITYDGIFRALRSMNRIWGVAEASAAWKEGELGDTYLIHPAILDVGLQIGMATFASLAKGTTNAALPTDIGKLVLDATRGLDRPPDRDRIDIQAHLLESSRTGHRLNIHIFDPYTKTPKVRIDGLVVRALTEPQPSEDRLIFAKTIWDVDVAHGFPSLPVAEITDYEQEYIEAVERTSFFFLRKICREFPEEVRAGLQPRHQTMLKGIEMILYPWHEGQQIALNPEWIKDTNEDIEELGTRFQASVDLKLLTAVGQNLPSVVHGESEMLEHMLKDDLLTRLYSDGRGFRECNQHVAFFMKKLTFKYPRARILEIGAGTGGTTYTVLEAINGAFASCTYTDVSSGFFEKAAERFSDYSECMEFKRLNIEAPPSSQGLADSSYDVVIAANVLHATRDIIRTVRHARSLLRPGGFLIGVEVTGNMLRETGLMAGLEGWWMGIDDGRFPLPGISVQAWDKLLSANGFSGIDSVNYDCPVTSKHNCSVFVTRAMNEQPSRISELSLSNDKGLRSPILVIGGRIPLVQDAVLQAKKLLQGQTLRVDTAAGFDSLDPSSISRDTQVLCLVELDKPICSSSVPNEASLKGLQLLLDTASNIVWVTSGGHDDDPYANMMIGIGRSLAFEVPNLRLQFLDFDASSRWDMRLAVQCLMQLVEQSSHRHNGLPTVWHHEPELRVRNGEVLIPRLVPDSAANTLLNATRRHITQQTTPDDVIEFSNGNPIYLTRPAPPHLSLPGSIKIHVERSLSLHSGVESASFLCFGYLEGKDVLSAALVDAQASVVHVDPNMILEIPSSYHCDAEGLVAFGSALIASHILHNSPIEDGVVVHDAPTGVAEALSVAADTGRHEVQFTTSTAKNSRLTGPNISRFVCSSAPCHSLTPGKGLLWLFSDVAVDKALNCFGGSCMVRRVNPSALILKHAMIAATFKLAERIKHTPAPKVVGVTENFLDAKSCPGHTKVVEWRTNAPLSITVSPTDVDRVFSNGQTYFLVGMTGDLGHSLCRFLVHHGVRHIAIASRTASKSKGWVATLTSLGVDIRVFNMDITDRKQVREVVAKIRRTMPPIAGVANAALVLEDSLFVNTSAEMMERQLRPKTEGTLHLHEEFSEKDLDFFVAFSSLGTVYGNPGQSIYNAANMFMTSLVQKRRKLGLAASVLHLGMVVDVGFVARTQRTKGNVEEHLESNFYTPLAETEFHHAFVQAVLASPETSSGDVTVGIQPYMDMPDSISKPPWYSHPRFSHMVTPFSAHAPNQRTVPKSDSRELFLRASSQSEAEEAFKKIFRKKIENMIKIPADRIDSEVPLVDLGLDSLLAVEIRTWLLEVIGIDVPLLGILGHESISSITPRVWDDSILLRKRYAPNDLSSPDAASHPRNASDADTAYAPIFDSSTACTDTIAQYSPISDMHESQQELILPDSGSDISEEERSAAPAVTSRSPDNESSTSKENLMASSVCTTTCRNEGREEDQVQMRSEKMSFAQASMYFMQSLLNDSTMFNVTAQYSITGHLNVERLSMALSRTLMRHEAYQSRFLVEPQHMQPLQAIVCDTESNHLGNLEIAEDKEVHQVFQRFAEHEYVLSKGDTFQAVLVTHSSVSHTLLVGCHHIIMDGVSWHVFLRDLTRSYEMLPLTKEVHSSFEFASHQHAQIASGAFEQSVRYWMHELDPILPVLPPLPLAHLTRKDFQQKYDTHTAQKTLHTEDTLRIVRASKENGTTTMQFYLAVLASLFARLLGLEEICIGVTDAGRGRFTEAIGHFTNLLPIRLSMDHDKSFTGLLHHTSQTFRQGTRHARVPFELLLERLGLPRSSQAAPLFQIAFNFRVGDLLNIKLGDCSMSLERYQDAKTPYDLVFNVTQTDSTHLVEVTSNSDMYSTTTTQWILDTYLHMVRTLASTPSINIKDCQLYDKTQVDGALSLGQGPRRESMWPATLIERFYQVCDSVPDAVAVKDATDFFTYSHLSSRVNTMAAAISKMGVAPGDHVVLLCQPSINTYAAMLAILHVGAVYVPIDLSVPIARQRTMTTVCQPKLIICDATTSDDAETLSTTQKYRKNQLNLADVTFDTDESTPKTFRDYGFLLFTSGSTGTPKGVRLTQSGIMNYAAAKAAMLDLGQLRVLQQSSTGFDMSLAQAFNAIANGGTLIIAPSSIRGDPACIAKLMLRESIQFTICTPSEYSTFIIYAIDTLRQCNYWQYACSGGEVMTSNLLSEFQRLELPGLTVADCYGPTELSCATTLNIIPLHPDTFATDMTHNVGKPIPNTSVYICGPDGEPQPVGFPGEICVGGKGVALGYFERDTDLGKFLRDPLAKYKNASRDFSAVYKTGDKGYLRGDGSVILMGRMEGDTVIKLRGLRIDLGEIAHAILATAKGTLAGSVVTVRGSPQFLVAHVVFAHKDDSSLGYLQELLSKLELPQYMIPSLILPLDGFPTTTNGKIDRKAIAAMPLPKQIDDRKNHTPMNVSEGEMQLIWKDVLGESFGAAVIGPETDFFAVGGSSLLLLRLQHIIKEKMGIAIELSDLYQSSTLGYMAAAANLGRSQLVPELINWKEETGVTRKPVTTTRIEESSSKRKSRVVLLTGATSFLGSHILAALIALPDTAKIYCIAVPADAQHQTPRSSKVIVYHGSLASPSFGLSSSELATIMSSTDQIIHAGAHGHCMNNYPSVRAANYMSTQSLAGIAAPRNVPFHFISSPRVVLLSGSHSAPPVSMSAHTPPTNGSEGFTASKWASEVYLENVAKMTGLPVSIHRPCSLIGAAATHDDALNYVIQYSVLSRSVPDIPYAHGFFDFRPVDEVAVEIASYAPARAGIAFHHHSSGVKVPFSHLATRMEKLHDGKFATVPIEEWIQKAADLGLNDLIVSYLRANIVGHTDLNFPYLGEQ